MDSPFSLDSVGRHVVCQGDHNQRICREVVMVIKAPRGMLTLFREGNDEYAGYYKVQGEAVRLFVEQHLGIRSIGIDSDEQSCEIAANRCVADTVARIERGEY